MRAALPTLVVLAVLAVVARVASGCADSDDETNHPLDDGGSDALVDGSVAHDSALSGEASADAKLDAAEACSPDGWCHTVFPTAAIAAAEQLDPAFVPIELHDVWVMPDHDAWAVAEQGYVLHWTKNAWTYAFGANAPLHAVWASSANDVWVAGPGGVAFHGTTTGGKLVFTRVETGTTDDILRVRGKSATDVLAVSENAILHSSGAAFVNVPFPNGITHDFSQIIGDLWESGNELWIGAREFSTCDQLDRGCGYQDRNVLLRWKGPSALPDAGPLAAFNRIPLDLVCDRDTCKIIAGTLAPDGSHFLVVKRHTQIVFAKPPVIAHVAARDAGLLDASAIQGDGGYVWTFDDPQASGAAPNGIWAATGKRAWFVASPGIVRGWNGQEWDIARVAIGTPLTKDLHAIEGVVATDGTSDMWIVGDNVALHRTGSP